MEGKERKKRLMERIRRVFYTGIYFLADTFYQALLSLLIFFALIGLAVFWGLSSANAREIVIPCEAFGWGNIGLIGAIMFCMCSFQIMKGITEKRSCFLSCCFAGVLLTILFLVFSLGSLIIFCGVGCVFLIARFSCGLSYESEIRQIVQNVAFGKNSISGAFDSLIDKTGSYAARWILEKNGCWKLFNVYETGKWIEDWKKHWVL